MKKLLLQSIKSNSFFEFLTQDENLKKVLRDNIIEEKGFSGQGFEDKITEGIFRNLSDRTNFDIQSPFLGLRPDMMYERKTNPKIIESGHNFATQSPQSIVNKAFCLDLPKWAAKMPESDSLVLLSYLTEVVQLDFSNTRPQEQFSIYGTDKAINGGINQSKREKNIAKTTQWFNEIGARFCTDFHHEKIEVRKQNIVFIVHVFVSEINYSFIEQLRLYLESQVPGCANIENLNHLKLKISY